jgi:hypothetical protein
MQYRDWDGMSARTLDAVYNYGFSAHPSRPYDPSDFRRCYNWYILNFSNIVSFKSFLKKVVKEHPIWKETAENWDELERLYLEETKKETSFGKAPKLYKFMEKIHKVS